MKTLSAGIPKITAAEVERLVRSLTTAEKTNLGIEVTVPVAYGDSTLVTVVIEQTRDAIVVHDASFSAMRLSGAGVSLSSHVIRRLSDLTQRYHCKFEQGRVTASATNVEELTTVIPLVANAARSVADYAYELRRQIETDFRLIVVEKLREIVGDRARDTEEFKGASGRRYRIPFILNAARSAPLYFISTLANRAAVPMAFATLSDLRSPFPSTERDAVYDDEAQIRDEDRTFLRSADAGVFGWAEAASRFSKEFARAQGH